MTRPSRTSPSCSRLWDTEVLPSRSWIRFQGSHLEAAMGIASMIRDKPLTRIFRRNPPPCMLRRTSALRSLRSLKTLAQIFRRSPAPSRFAVLLPSAHFVRYGRMDRAPCSDSTLPACPPPPARARLTAAQGTVPLPLLPSGPDGVRGRPFAQGPGLQRHVRGHRPERGKPRQGIRPHWSGLWATGHRYLPV